MSSTVTQHHKRDARCTILIVEDDPALSKTFLYLLGDAYALAFAKTGSQALTAVKRHRNISLVLLDYQLPDMSGIDVLRSMRESTQDVPVIFITAFGSEEVAVKAFTSGAVNYIKKPFTYTELTGKIHAALFPEEATPGELKHQEGVIFSAQDEKRSADHVRTAHALRIQRAIKYLDDNYAVKTCFEGAAEKACLSKHHFSRVFREVAGVSFKEYVLNLKMTKAKEWLKNSDMTVSEIAAAAGYEDASHFVKTFKKQTGYTPLQYRHRIDTCRSDD